MLKVRTGCITCKIRKVKCDEDKPVCRRCTSTGRKCDGYSNSSVVKNRRDHNSCSARKKALLRSDDVICIHDNFPLTTISDKERRWLKYFSSHAAPILSDVTNGKFWCYLLPQLSLSETPIRHALLALAMSFAQNEAELGAVQVMGTVDQHALIMQYNLAIASLRQNLVQPSQNVEVPLICCLLFICLECLHDNRSKVLDHLRSGINILASARFRDADPKFDRPTKDVLQDVFRRLEAQSTLHGNAASSVFGVLNNTTTNTALTLPTTFDDIAKAKHSLDIIISMGLNFTRSIQDDIYLGQADKHGSYLLRNCVLEHLINWKNCFNRFESAWTPQDPSYIHLATQLRIQHSATFIYIANILEPDEISFDAFRSEFALITRLAQSLCAPVDDMYDSKYPFSNNLSPSPLFQSSPPPPATPTFSLDMSLLPALYLTAIKCRDSSIRHEALTLLKAKSGREGMWNAKLHYKVARRLVEIEEAETAASAKSTKFESIVPAFAQMQVLNDGAFPTKLPGDRFLIDRVDIDNTSKVDHDQNQSSQRFAPVTFSGRSGADGTCSDGPRKSWEEKIWY